MTIAGELERSLQTTPRMPRDAVTVALAMRYAQALDDLFDRLGEAEAEEDAAQHARVVLEISRMGARFEAQLDRLGMSPASRPRSDGGGGAGDGDPSSTALEQLRADAAAGTPTSGFDYAAAVHPAVTEADAAD